MIDYIFDVMKSFNGSFINANKELILIPKTNLYVSLREIETEIDLKCKLLECCSRECCKSRPYASERFNIKHRNESLCKLNRSLGTQFSNYEIITIYQKLGDGINRKLTKRFVDSGYDLKVLEE